MKTALLIYFLQLGIFTTYCQQKEIETFPLVIRFASHCCGVPSDTSVVNFITCFRRSFKTESLAAKKIGPMGKEGEYYLAFSLDELSSKRAKKFVKEIECISIAPGDKGSIHYEKDFTVDYSTIISRGRTTVTTVKF
jgi:hypothetical protein